MEEADVLEIIDHHRLSSIETMGPVYFRNQPVGCTATIVYQMYEENGIAVDAVNAALLCSAIISDTLMFRSPTCTPLDEVTARKLAEIASINIEELAQEMFNAGSNLKGKSAEEILFLDFKQFTVNDTMFGVGQVNSMSAEELKEIKERVLPHMEKARKKSWAEYDLLYADEYYHRIFRTDLLWSRGERKNSSVLMICRMMLRY